MTNYQKSLCKLSIKYFLIEKKYKIYFCAGLERIHSQILLLKKVAWHGDSFIFNFLEAFYLNQITCIRFLKALHSKTGLQSTPPCHRNESALSSVLRPPDFLRISQDEKLERALWVSFCLFSEHKMNRKYILGVLFFIHKVFPSNLKCYLDEFFACQSEVD